MTEKKPRKLSRSRQEELYVQELATKAFAEHQIRTRSDRAMLISRKRPDGTWDSLYWSELVLMRNGLLVYGDIQPVVFGDNACATLEEATEWLSERIGSSYVNEKAHIGMRLQKVDSTRITYAHAAILRAHTLLRPVVTSLPDEHPLSRMNKVLDEQTRTIQGDKA